MFVVTASSEIFAVVTASFGIFAVVTASSAICAVSIEPAAISASTAPATILPAVTELSVILVVLIFDIHTWPILERPVPTVPNESEGQVCGRHPKDDSHGES